MITNETPTIIQRMFSAMSSMWPYAFFTLSKMRFTNFANTGRCWPTRAAVLAGYYAQQVRRDTVPGVPSAGPDEGLRNCFGDR